MKSFTSRRFRERYSNLPDEIKQRAKRAYQLFRRNPTHPGLSFKKVDDEEDIYSVGLDSATVLSASWKGKISSGFGSALTRSTIGF